MSTFAKKFRLLFLPVIAAIIFWLILYTFLHWIFIIKPGVTSLKQTLVNILAPLVIPLVPVFIWLRPRMKLLLFPRKRGNPLYAYTIFCSAIIGAPVAAAQYYLETSTGKLTVLPAIENIPSAPVTKYYTIKGYYADKSLVKRWRTSELAGKGRGYIILNRYYAVPMEEEVYEPTLIGTLNVATNTTKAKDSYTFKQPQLFAWLCIDYRRDIPNSKSDTVRMANKDAFYDSCYKTLMATNLHNVVYFDRIGYTDKRNGYLSAIYGGNFTRDNIKNTILLEPKFTAFENRNGSSLTLLFAAFGAGMCVWLLFISIPKLDEEKLAAFYAQSAAHNKQ